MSSEGREDVENGAASGGPEAYKPPAQKSVEEIIKADAEDESLEKYKRTLLGNAAQGDKVIVGKVLFLPLYRLMKFEITECDSGCRKVSINGAEINGVR